MSIYRGVFSTRRTPQSEPIPGSDQVMNTAGGYTWEISKWDRLDRFLMIGTEGGTYYTKERPLTLQNAQNVLECLKEDAPRTVGRIMHISRSRRAPKNDPALFALAVAFLHKKTDGQWLEKPSGDFLATALQTVARTGTHLFTFLEMVNGMRGWGSVLRGAVQKWYLAKEPDQLAYQMVKYRQRGGWTHRDALRLSHPKTADPQMNALFKWTTSGEVVEAVPETVKAYAKMAGASSPKEVVALLGAYPNLPWETIPSQHLADKDVWEALLPNLPMTATIRNLGRMASYGLLEPYTESERIVLDRLFNTEQLLKSGIHPISVLIATLTYKAGKGMRGSLRWTPNQRICDELNNAFYKSFGSIKPTNQRVMVALDISASMEWTDIMNVPGLTPRTVASAMALSIIRSEPRAPLVTGFSHSHVVLPIGRSTTLEEADRITREQRHGATDCAQPMLYAYNRETPIDLFVIFTDNETWRGDIHPAQALRLYRSKFVKHAKLIVVAMTATGFSIADPKDAGMLDVVGFDAMLPNIISAFATVGEEDD